MPSPALDATPRELDECVGQAIYGTGSPFGAKVVGWTPHGWPLVRKNDDPAWFGNLCLQKVSEVERLLKDARSRLAQRAGRNPLQVERVLSL